MSREVHVQFLESLKVRFLRATHLIVAFQSESEAKAFGSLLRNRLSKFGLKVQEEKSQTIAFGRYAWYKAQKEGIKLKTFDFLGLLHKDKER